jgi:hypothetical protein
MCDVGYEIWDMSKKVKPALDSCNADFIRKAIR